MRLQIQTCNLSGDALPFLNQLTRLKELYLPDNPDDDETLQSLADLKSLTYFALNETDVSDRSAGDWAAFSGLKDLELNSTLISDKTIDQLAKLNLDSLYIENCDVSDDAMDRFLEDNPDCSAYLSE